MMNRRELLSGIVGALTSPMVLHEGDQPIKGVGVLRFPLGEKAEQDARNLSNKIRQGTIIALPNMRDDSGAYEWDFRIEGGDPGQVTIKRA